MSRKQFIFIITILSLCLITYCSEIEKISNLKFLNKKSESDPDVNRSIEEMILSRK